MTSQYLIAASRAANLYVDVWYDPDRGSFGIGEWISDGQGQYQQNTRYADAARCTAAYTALRDKMLGQLTDVVV